MVFVIIGIYVFVVNIQRLLGESRMLGNRCRRSCWISKDEEDLGLTASRELSGLRESWKVRTRCDKRIVVLTELVKKHSNLYLRISLQRGLSSQAKTLCHQKLKSRALWLTRHLHSPLSLFHLSVVVEEPSLPRRSKPRKISIQPSLFCLVVISPGSNHCFFYLSLQYSSS